MGVSGCCVLCSAVCALAVQRVRLRAERRASLSNYGRSMLRCTAPPASGSVRRAACWLVEHRCHFAGLPYYSSLPIPLAPPIMPPRLLRHRTHTALLPTGLSRQCSACRLAVQQARPGVGLDTALLVPRPQSATSAHCPALPCTRPLTRRRSSVYLLVAWLW